MKKLVLRVLLLGLPFGVFLSAFEFTYASSTNNQYTAKRELLAAVINETEVLFLGSSHGYYDILPEHLGRAGFNLAGVSQSIFYDAQLAHRYAGVIPALKAVVIAISYVTLETELDESPERWRCYYYCKVYGLSHRDRHMAADVRNFFLYFLYGRDYPFKRVPMLKQDATSFYDRWGGLKKSEGTMQSTAEEALLRHHHQMKPEHLADNVHCLERLAAELESRRIRLILITTPVTADYRKGMQPIAYGRMQKALHTLEQHTATTYRNYIADERFGPEDFHDADHLNRVGAAKFTALLGRDLFERKTTGSAEKVQNQF